MKSSSDRIPWGRRRIRHPASRVVTVLVALFLLLLACRIGPNCGRPDLATPAVFRGASGAAQQASLADLPWLDLFRDETLEGLIQIALANNQDLAATVARVEQARQVAAEARSQYLLAIGYSTAPKVCFPGSLGRNPGAIEKTARLLEETIPLDVPARPTFGIARAPVGCAGDRGDGVVCQRPDRHGKGGVLSCAFFGKLSTTLANLSSGQTNAWSLVSNVLGPIFQGGALKAWRRQAVASWEEARANYVQTALGAFRNVSDTLISREKYDAVPLELQSNEQSARLSLTRYVEVLSSYNEGLEAQQRLYPTQLALAETKVSRRPVFVQLYERRVEDGI